MKDIKLILPASIRYEKQRGADTRKEKKIYHEYH